MRKLLVLASALSLMFSTSALALPSFAASEPAYQVAYSQYIDDGKAGNIRIPLTSATGQIVSENHLRAQDEYQIFSSILKVPQFNVLGFTWPLSYTGELEVEVRVKTRTGWGTWEDLDADESSSGRATLAGTEPFAVGSATELQLRIKTDGKLPADLSLQLYLAGPLPASQRSKHQAQMHHQQNNLKPRSVTKSGYLRALEREKTAPKYYLQERDTNLVDGTSTSEAPLQLLPLSLASSEPWPPKTNPNPVFSTVDMNTPNPHSKDPDNPTSLFNENLYVAGPDSPHAPALATGPMAQPVSGAALLAAYQDPDLPTSPNVAAGIPPTVRALQLRQEREAAQRSNPAIASEVSINRLRPGIISRAQWRPETHLVNNPRKYWRPKYAALQGAIVHHTAGKNDYTPEEAPAIVRSIYRFHAVTRGWGDIGYNFLVSRYGQIFEGREGTLQSPDGTMVVGGHARPRNTHTMGVSVMGDFEQQQPPAIALEAVSRVIGWEFARAGLDPTAQNSGLTVPGNFMGRATGSPLPRVVGHKDVSKTTCPGLIYEHLGQIAARAKTDQRMPDTTALAEPNVTAQVNRLAGSDRVGTSLASWSIWPQQPKYLILVGKTGVVDALSVTPLAKRLQAAVAYTDSRWLSPEIEAHLRVAWPKLVYLAGGPGVISRNVEQRLRSMGVKVKRLAGRDRFGTSYAVALETLALYQRRSSPLIDGVAGTPTLKLGDVLGDPDAAADNLTRSAGSTPVFLTTGENFADALSAGPAAAAAGGIVLLSHKDNLPYITSRFLLTGRNPVTAVGGPAVAAAASNPAVSAQVVRRITGADRYEVSAKLNEMFFPSRGHYALASGQVDADAVIASAFIANLNSGVLLTKADEIPSAVSSALGQLVLPESKVWIFGGEGVISTKVATQAGQVGSIE